MPIKPEDVLTALDIDPSKFDDVAAFTGEFSNEWLRRSEAAKDEKVRGAVFGEINNVQRGKAKKALKALGFEDVKVEDMDPADIFTLIGEKVPAKITAIQEAAKGTGKSSAELEAERTVSAELRKKLEDTEKLHAALAKQYTDLETNVKQDKWNTRKRDYIEQAKAQVKLRQGMSEFERDGFFSRALSMVDLRPDDKDAIYVVDANSGERIAEPGKAQKFLDLAPFLALKAKEFKLDETNPHGGKPVGGQRPISQMPNRESVPQAPGARKVHPAFGKL